jgi:HNH endonuclease
MKARCIYCSESKPLSEFNTEHVIQHSMTPGIQKNLTLIERVCVGCNAYFDTELDRPLAKDSIHGLDRFMAGIKPAKKLKDFKGRDVEMQTSSENPDLNGVTVRAIERDGALAYALRAHLLLERKSDNQPIRVYKEDLVAGLPDLDLSSVTGRIKAWAESEQEEKEIWNLAQTIFSKRGHPLTVTGTYIPGTVPVFAEVEFEIRSFRTFAKIAFNYMAKMTEHVPTFVLQNCFDDARKFVRYGDIPGYRIVEPVGNVGHFDMLGFEKNPIGHFADLRLHREGIHYKVDGRVTLFNRFGWLVRLCPDYRGLHFDFDRMHHWNFETMICESFANGKATTRNN